MLARKYYSKAAEPIVNCGNVCQSSHYTLQYIPFTSIHSHANACVE